MEKLLKIGITGSRNFKNKEIVRKAIDEAIEGFGGHSFELHHGDCIGADEIAHQIAVERGFKVVIHPPNVKKNRAFCDGGLILKERAYIDRNHDIVDSCDVLLAFTETPVEKLRSGTWATIRYARKSGNLVIITTP